jgi:uncharacterized membrane protein YebE (DUF533 family)
MAEEKKGTNWVMTCGIGCGVLLVVGIIVVLVGGYMMKAVYEEGIEQVRVQMVADADEVYQRLKSEGKIAASDTALIDEAHTLSQQAGSSAFAVGMCSAVIAFVDADGVLSDDERSMSNTMLEKVRQDPGMGLIAFGQFIAENPELQQQLEEIQSDIQAQQAY